MKRLSVFLAIPAAVLFLPCLARAEDAPSPEKPVPQLPAPEAPVSGDPAPKAARREDEDEAQERASRIDKMAAYFRSRGGLADSLATVSARAEKAEKELAAVRDRFTALTKENERLKADWTALEVAALAPGAAQTEASQMAAAAIHAQVGKELRAIGHVPKPKDDDKTHPPAARPLTALQLIALGRQQARLN